MYVTIQCSNCGKCRRISTAKQKYIINVISQGWGSFGGALYCPECSATWEERNRDKPMANALHTYNLILDRIIGAVNSAWRGGNRE